MTIMRRKRMSASKIGMRCNIISITCPRAQYPSDDSFIYFLNFEQVVLSFAATVVAAVSVNSYPIIPEIAILFFILPDYYRLIDL